MSRDISIKQGIDWVTVFMYVVMVIAGWLSIYGASYDFDQSSIFDFGNRAGKQFVWILTAFGIAGLLMLIDDKVYNSIVSNFIYIAVTLLLIVTIFIAPDIKGSHSWIRLGSFLSIQPAEFAKIATALAVSRFLATNGKNMDWKNYVLLLGITLLPLVIIILQKETGSALVLLAFFLVFYREGMKGLILLLGVFAIVLFIVIVRFGEIPIQEGKSDLGIIIAFGAILLVQVVYAFFVQKAKKEALWLLGITIAIAAVTAIINIWIITSYNYAAYFAIAASVVYWVVIELVKHSRKFRGLILFIIGAVLFCFAADYIFDSILKPHQQTRIKVVLNMEDDLSGAGYNVNQSKIAIGSGGLLGKGFLNGTQTKLKYVPEQDTDFIFCTVGEEFGFVGSSLVLILFMVFLLRIIHIAERQRETFNRIYGYCVVSIFFFHIMVNIGMVLGLMPVIGIPLPFFSYGGSSLWAFTILLFILLRLDASRSSRVRYV
ncbi:rod shape-determining protein RodA [Paludibacter sp. 221]|uniref:rod shape-determining protein RodA n=1 Tax=Paludibacter sp. 221 TaxID=2302939 RepID=UPI0013D02539|nr:rod shape-determining protein RodA [Paludibacter sp. 221]NDV47189.1 rod shape-determining protein RodA [Paludibacter sp. 221]